MAQADPSPGPLSSLSLSQQARGSGWTLLLTSDILAREASCLPGGSAQGGGLPQAGMVFSC